MVVSSVFIRICQFYFLECFWQTTSKTDCRTTPLKTIMSPENRWLEDVFPTEMVPFFFGDMLNFRSVAVLDGTFEVSPLWKGD